MTGVESEPAVECRTEMAVGMLFSLSLFGLALTGMGWLGLITPIGWTMAPFIGTTRSLT